MPPRLRLFAAWTAWVGVAFYLAWIKRPGQVDDAFIYLRYARNVLDGRGWVFNEGEWVNGATSTGNTLLLIAFGWLTGGRLVLAQLLIFATTLGSACFFTQRMTRRWGLVPSSFAGLSVLTLPYLYWLVGMDSAPILGFACAAVWAYHERRYRSAALLLSGLVLVRGDGALLALVLIADFVVRERRRLRASLSMVTQSTLLFLLPQAIWALCAIPAFGSALPKTLGAKLAQTASGLHGPPPVFLNHWFENLKLFVSIRLQWLEGDALGNVVIAMVVLLFVAAALGSVVIPCLRARATEDDAPDEAPLPSPRPLWPLIAFGLGQWLAYAWLDLPNYLWYFLPFNLALALGVAGCFAWLWNRFAGVDPMRSVARGLAIGLAAIWLAINTPDPRWIEDAKHLPYNSVERTADYRRFAEWWKANKAKGQSLACCEIGALGWHLPDTSLVDMWGLVTKGGIEAISAGDFTWWFDAKPDYVLLHGDLAKAKAPWVGPEQQGMLDKRFAAYELEKTFEADALMLFRRKD